MATKTRARTAGGVKPASKVSSKQSKAAPKKAAVAKSAKRAKSEGKVIAASGGAGSWNSRDKKYSQLFGSIFPKGRVFGPDGVAVPTQIGSKLAISLAQYSPTAERMSWVYITHGLSQARSEKDCRLELMLHSRSQDEAAIRVLSRAASYILENGTPLSPGELISSSQLADPGLPGLQHWIVAEPDKTIPEKMEQPGGAVKLVLLLGVSDAEMQVALKVNPELADGRRVLMEALRIGGVFPVTDPKRTCLTRRRDYLRLWETAFRTVRESRAK